MDKRLIAPLSIAAAFVLLLTLLFGLAGLKIGLFVVVSTKLAAIILFKLGFEPEFAAVVGLPASMILHSTFSFGLGFFIGLTASVFVSLGLLAVAAFGLWFLPSINLKKKSS